MISCVLPHDILFVLLLMATIPLSFKQTTNCGWVTLQLGQLERLIADQLPQLGQTFIRVGKSLIINSSAVYYINVSKQQLILMDTLQNRHTFTAGKEALKTLKDWFENNQDNERN